MKKKLALIAVAPVAVVVLAAPANAEESAPTPPPATTTSMTGDCSSTSTLTVKTRTAGNRIRLTAHLDDGTRRHHWTWRIGHDDVRVAHGLRATRGTKADFNFTRLFRNLSGTDVFTVRLVDRNTGEICKASVKV